MMKRTFFLVLVLEGLVGHHRTVQPQLLGISGWSIDLDYCCLGKEQRSFCHYGDCTQVLHFRLSCTMRATPFLVGILAYGSRYNDHLN